MELLSDDGNSQMELPGKRSKRGSKLQAQPAVKDKDFEIGEQQSRGGRESGALAKQASCYLSREGLILTLPILPCPQGRIF